MQNQKFDTVQCSRLEVLDSDGNVRLVLNDGRADSDNTPPQDVVEILRKDGSAVAKVSMWNDNISVYIPKGSIEARSFTASGTSGERGEASLYPGKVEVKKPVPYIDPMEYYRKSSYAQVRGDKTLAPKPIEMYEQAVCLSCNEHGGKASVYGEGAGDMYGKLTGSLVSTGRDTQNAVEIDFDQETKHGRVRVIHRHPVWWIDEEKGYQEGQRETASGLFITEHGGEFVAVGKYDESLAVLGVEEHGGRVNVFGKDRRSRARLACDEHGNGTVTTWDKDDYKQ